MATLFVCEKHVVRRLVDEGFRDRRLGAGTAHVMPWLTDYTPSLLRRARRDGRPRLVFLGDLDPDAIFQFASLRAGGRSALLDGAPPALKIKWGVNRHVVRAIRERAGDLERRTIHMTWLSRKYWRLVKRLVPDARHLLGEHAFDLLERGMKLELDALTHDDDFGLLPALLARHEHDLRPAPNPAWS